MEAFFKVKSGKRQPPGDQQLQFPFCLCQLFLHLTHTDPATASLGSVPRF